MELPAAVTDIEKLTMRPETIPLHRSGEFYSRFIWMRINFCGFCRFF
jgi:hypothetical protein